MKTHKKTADEIEAKANHYKCTEPDPKMIEAAKAIQEKNKKITKLENYEN